MEDSQELTHLAQLCRLRARTHRSHCAVDDGTVRLTYAELAGRAEAVSARLRELGVGSDSLVVLEGRNRSAWVVAAFGVLMTGATLAPIGYGLPAHERRRVLAALRPAAVISEASSDDPSHLSFADAMALPPMEVVGEPEVLAPDAPALLLSSSGTTGGVKMVSMTHRQLARLYSDVARRLGVTDADRMLAVPPLSHSLGFNGILLVAVIVGAAVRLCPAYSREETAALIVSEQISVLSGPPTLFHDLERNIGPGALRGVARLAVVGGQTVLVGEFLATARRLGLREVVIGYGMTEACGTVALARLEVDDSWRREDQHVALTTMPGVEVCIGGDPEGVDLTGPILVRGYNIVPVEGTDPDAWFDTGDVGHLDSEGRLIVVGRSTDRVIVSGFNVYPRDVERVLARHRGVEQVAVLGLPDQRTGERLVACVVARDAELDLEELCTYARQHLAAYQVPAEFLFLPELPLTASGKVARAELVNRATTGLA